MCVHIHMYTHTRMYTCVHVSVYMYMYTYVYVRTYKILPSIVLWKSRSIVNFYWTFLDTFLRFFLQLTGIFHPFQENRKRQSWSGPCRGRCTCCFPARVVRLESVHVAVEVKATGGLLCCSQDITSVCLQQDPGKVPLLTRKADHAYCDVSHSPCLCSFRVILSSDAPPLPLRPPYPQDEMQAQRNVLTFIPSLCLWFAVF